MTTQEAIARVLAIARAEVGYREKASGSGLDDKTANAGSGNYTKYARDLDRIPGFYNGPKQGFAWCDVFYDWLIVEAFGADTARKLLCQPDNSAGAGCYYSAMYYRQAGRFFMEPQPGDQIFFTFSAGEVSHTGIVETVSSGTVATIEGNSSDGVNRRSYSTGSGSIYGYGRPDWSLVADVPEVEPETGTDPVSPPAPAEIPAHYTIALPALQEGDVSTFVERVQTLLIARGYYCGGRIFSGRERADGEFGPSTKIAVMDLQLSCGIETSGIIDADTMLALLTQ